MIYCNQALQVLLQKQVHRLRKAGATDGVRNGKVKILMTKQISEDIMKMAGLVKQQAYNLLWDVILMCKNILPIQLAMILNESALKVMKFKNPIGQIVKDNGQQWHVVGVIKDFILESPYQPIKPMLIYGPKSWFSIMQCKTEQQKHHCTKFESNGSYF